MTPKYLQNEINSSSAVRSGIIANPDQWNGMPVTVAEMDDSIKSLQDNADELEIAEIALKKLQKKSREMVLVHSQLREQAENLAKGIHAKEPEKLLEYGLISKGKYKSQVAVPRKAIILSINDNVDGEGFILDIQSLANASDFEIWRGMGTTLDTLALEPDLFSYLSTTKKLSYTDSDIQKGKRYFYRLRGFNRTGKGEWSSIASRVQ